jgi:hypothetical protein
VILLLIAGCGIYSCIGSGLFAPGAVAAYLLLMLLPGAGLYLLLEKEPRLLELALACTVLSPILVSILAVLVMLSGPAPKTAALIITSLAAVFVIAATLIRTPLPRLSEISIRQGLILSGIIFVFCALTGYLPLTDEWWRLRSDAWFHIATVAQISNYGVPPEDPYFYGIPLQYMWFYHVLVLIVSRATGITSPFVMAIFNMQALAGFMLAAFLLSQLLKNRFAHGVSSMLTGILGINALFWLFLPIKIIPAFVGEERGMEVVHRALTLSPLENLTVRKFLNIYSNQYFFLNKFIVLTAFSIALSFMAACWYGMTCGIAKKRAFPIVLTFFMAVGMVAFHPIVGFISLAGLGGGIFLFYVSGSRFGASVRKTSLLLLIMLVAAVAVLSPYLYDIMHGKDSDQLSLINVSFRKIAGLVISCALGILLAAFQVKKLIARQKPEARFFVLAAFSIIVVCLIIFLPGPNIYDKPAFFMFFPLAIAGGWTLAELPERKFALFQSKPGMALVFIVLFLPLNLIAFLGDYSTPTHDMLSVEETQIAAWARENTTRDAVFIDNKDRNFILVAGPRRNFYGSHSYAKQWGYDKEEMSRRKRMIDNIYSNEPLEPSTLAALCDIDPDVYIVLRGRDESNTDANKFLQIEDLFIEAYSTGPAAVLKVNKDACRNRSIE